MASRSIRSKFPFSVAKDWVLSHHSTGSRTGIFIPLKITFSKGTCKLPHWPFCGEDAFMLGSRESPLASITADLDRPLGRLKPWGSHREHLIKRLWTSRLHASETLDQGRVCDPQATLRDLLSLMGFTRKPSGVRLATLANNQEEKS